MLPPESVIEPSDKVNLPIVDPVSALIVPVVIKFSSSKEIVPSLSVIVPLLSVRSPIVAPSPAFIVLKLPVSGDVEPITVPSIEPPSMFISSIF